MNNNMFYLFKVFCMICWMLLITFTCPITIILWNIKKTKFIIDKLEIFNKKNIKMDWG